MFLGHSVCTFITGQPAGLALGTSAATCMTKSLVSSITMENETHVALCPVLTEF